MPRVTVGRHAEPTAVIYDIQTLQSTPERGEHGGYDGYKRRTGSKIHIAVDTLGHLLALVAPPANAQDRAQVAELSRTVQDVTSGTVEVAVVDQGYTGPAPEADAATHGSRHDVVTLSEAKRGFVLLPRRWVVERSFASKSHFRRLVRDYERRLSVLAGLHLVAFACLELTRAAPLLQPHVSS
jgi:transposase